MSARWCRRLGVAAAALALTGCAGARVEHGVFRAPALFRVAVPGPDWQVTRADDADLELRHRDGAAALVASAECGAAAARADEARLIRRLFIGLRARTVVENGSTVVDGRPAARTVLEAQAEAAGERMRVEAIVMKGERCVYDLLYVAPAATFETWRAEFGRFVASFVRE